MTPELYRNVLLELVILYLGMWGITLTAGVIMILRARHLDPLPLLPTIGLVFTITIGLRLTTVWLGMTFEIPDWRYLHEYFESIQNNRRVLRPLWTLTGALAIHYLIYAFGELRHSGRRGRLTSSTRMVFHAHLLLLFLCILVHLKIYRHTLHRQIRQFRELEGAGEIYVEQPGEKTERFRMIFVPGDF